MTGQRKQAWPPRWWVATTSIINYTLGVGITIHETLVTSSPSRPEIVGLAILLLLGTRGLNLIDRRWIDKQ